MVNGFPTAAPSTWNEYQFACRFRPSWSDSPAKCARQWSAATRSTRPRLPPSNFQVIRGSAATATTQKESNSRIMNVDILCELP